MGAERQRAAEQKLPVHTVSGSKNIATTTRPFVV
jgi:hypothetical protein